MTPGERSSGSIVALYDMKADPAQRETMTYEENGKCHGFKGRIMLSSYPLEHIMSGLYDAA